MDHPTPTPAILSSPPAAPTYDVRGPNPAAPPIHGCNPAPPICRGPPPKYNPPVLEPFSNEEELSRSAPSVVKEDDPSVHGIKEPIRYTTNFIPSHSDQTSPLTSNQPIPAYDGPNVSPLPIDYTTNFIQHVDPLPPAEQITLTNYLLSVPHSTSTLSVSTPPAPSS